MDTEAATAMLQEARRELSAARLRVAHLEQVVDGLTGLLNAAGIDVGVGPSPQDTLPGLGGPREVVANMRPRDSVLYVLSRRPGLAMSPRRIYDYLVQHGMVNSEMKSGVAAYDMALRRLAEEFDSGVERDDATGTYTLRPGVGSGIDVRNRRTHAMPGRDVQAAEAAVREAHERSRPPQGGKTERTAPESEKSRKLTIQQMREIEARRNEVEQRRGVVVRPSAAPEKRDDMQ